ncbi:cytochrome P450 49a1 [Biomphalaria glabrata]|nr:cytochrome P450 49a1 [Biomphalaria glabrata]
MIIMGTARHVPANGSLVTTYLLARCFCDGVSAAKSREVLSTSKVLPMRLMPGPSGLMKLPYIGTALMFAPFSRHSPENFGALVADLHEKYGPVFKSRLGKDYSVHTDNAEDAEAIFRNEGPFPLRRLMTLSKVFRERNGLPPALGTVSGPAWQELRSAINPLLMKPSVCIHYLPAQNHVADDFVNQLQNPTLTPDAQSELLFKFALESIGMVCFNQRLGFLDPTTCDSPDRLELLHALKLCLKSIFLAMLGMERRYLRTADDAFYRSYENAMKLIRQRAMIYVRKIVQDVNRTDLESPAQDSNLLESMLTKGNLQMEKVLAIIDSMLIGGTDSTARNMTVLIYNLAMNPEAQERAAKEVHELVGLDDPITPEALAKLVYLKACVKESMRINFPLANGTERSLNIDTVIGGYLVPKGTSVIMSSSRSSLDARYFSEPKKFLPERWLRREGEVVRQDSEDKKFHPFAYLPFGHGARGCIGRRFAEMEIYVGTAKLLQKLKITVDPKYEGLKPIYTPFITPEKPIPFIFTARQR